MVDTRSVIRATLAVLGILLAVYMAYRVASVLVLMAVAILLATAIEPLVLRLHQGPFSRGQGILVIYTAIFIVLGGLVYFSVSIVGREGDTLAASLPASVEHVRQSFNTIRFDPVRTVLLQLLDQVAGAVQRPEAAAATSPDAAKKVGTGLFTAIFDVVTVFVLAFYWLTERTLIKRAITGLLERQHRSLVLTVWNDVEQRLGGWVRGQLVLMVSIGVAAGAGWSLMGVPFAPVLAIIAGLVEVVPILGPWLGTAPAVLLAFAVSPQKALLVLAYGILIQQVEANILVPRIMRNTTGISPLTVLVGILAGEAVAGITGAMLAVPIAASLQVLLQDLLRAGAEQQAAEDHPTKADALAAAAIAAGAPEGPVREATRAAP